MTEKPFAEQVNPQSLLDKAAASLAEVQESSRKVQELKAQLESGRNAVEELIGSLIGQTAAAERFEEAAEAAEAQQEQVEEQLENLDARLDTVFDALEEVAEERAEAPVEAPALPDWFNLPAGFANLADLAADVENALQNLDMPEVEAPVLNLADVDLRSTLLQVSAELSALNLLDVFAAEEEPEVAEDVEETVEEAQVNAAPLQEVASAFPGYNPVWMALGETEAASAEPLEAPTAPLAKTAAAAEETAFTPAWFKATEEKEAAAAVKAAEAEAEAEVAAAAPVAPLVDEDDPVEIAARAMEARRLQEETEKMAAQLAEAERMRLKAEEELRRILQEIEGEKQNDADDDIAAILRGFRH